MVTRQTRETRRFADDSVAVHGFWGPPGAPTVLFVHGAGGDHRFWTAQTRALGRADRTSVAIDLPGRGASHTTPGGGIAARRAAVGAFLAEHDTDDVSLVGHSMGAIVALDVAGRHPDRISSLALLGAGASMQVNPALIDAAAAGDAAVLDRMVRWMFARDETDERRASARQSILAVGLDVLADDLTAVRDWDATPERAATVTSRSLVVSGAQDRMTPPDDGRALADLLGAEYHLIDDGHMFPQTSHEETNRILGVFLG